MTQYFKVDQINKTYLVVVIKDKLPFTCVSGSFNVLGARVLGLNYSDYLRLARDTYHATLKGQSGWIHPFFLEEKDALIFCGILNRQLNQIFNDISKQCS